MTPPLFSLRYSAIKSPDLEFSPFGGSKELILTIL
jgi:hypothetical protein